MENMLIEYCDCGSISISLKELNQNTEKTFDFGLILSILEIRQHLTFKRTRRKKNQKTDSVLSSNA